MNEPMHHQNWTLRPLPDGHVSLALSARQEDGSSVTVDSDLCPHCAESLGLQVLSLAGASRTAPPDGATDLDVSIEDRCVVFTISSGARRASVPVPWQEALILVRSVSEAAHRQRLVAQAESKEGLN